MQKKKNLCGSFCLELYWIVLIKWNFCTLATVIINYYYETDAVGESAIYLF